MSDIKKQVEAILFSVGKYISLEEIAGLCKKEPQRVKEVLLELQADYETDPDTSLIILNDGDLWKLTTREEYGKLVKNIVSETELSKTVLETLAVIAFKYPIKQADLIRIRTNKAYGHLMELEKIGFISRQKYGRTRLIKLTDKFFEYFDLPQDKLKERFKGFEDLANTIEKKEDEIDDLKEKQQKMAEEAKIEEEKERKLRDGNLEIDLIDEHGGKHSLEKFDEPKKDPKIEQVEDMLGDLEVVDETNLEEAKPKESSQKDDGSEKEDIPKSVEELFAPDEHNDNVDEEDESEDKEESSEDNIEEEKGEGEQESDEEKEESNKERDAEEKEDGVDLIEAKEQEEDQEEESKKEE